MSVIESKPLVPQTPQAKAEFTGIKPAQMPTSLGNKAELLASKQFERIEDFRQQFLNS